MIIEKLSGSYVREAENLFNRAAEAEVVYKKLSSEEFRKNFLEDDEQMKKFAFAALEEGKTVGFSAGVCMKGKDRVYVTFVLVDPNCRFKGIGTALLKALEDKLIAESDQKPSRIWMYFLNPVALTWVIPRTDHHDHPNAPGIDVSSGAYLFFKNRGYIHHTTENSYYIPLENYEFPEIMKTRLEQLKEKGLAIGYYDGELNYGLDELTDDLGSEVWRNELLGNAALPGGGDPLIVAIDAGVENKDRIVTDKLGKCPGKVVGFTGPIHVQESGRGYFSGIGVHSAYRQSGLGTCLFASLCRGQQEIGSRFMSLFTGEDNPARNIYERAGFKIVHTWASMKKDLKE